MNIKTNYYENQLKRVHVPEGHTPSININHQTNWMDINEESAPVLIEYLKKFLPQESPKHYYMVHHYHRHGDSKYIFTSPNPGLDNFVSDDSDRMDESMKTIIEMLGIEYEENADEWVSVDKVFGEIPELNIDGEGYPACKKYKGETVLPNEQGNCSLCEGDCTEQ